jgi:hypothetical protein
MPNTTRRPKLAEIAAERGIDITALQASRDANGTLVGMSTTGTVHAAKPVLRKSLNHITLKQVCGMNRNQHAYLFTVVPGTPITCKRCGA